MKLYKELIKFLINKLKGYSNGEAILEFAKNMGIVYIKFAQILSTQNYGNLFSEKDRKDLEKICADINPISYDKIEEILKKEYGNLDDIFESIDEYPIGSASVSQVHKAVLKNGDVVAIKVKRKDIADKIDKDIKQLRHLMMNYGFIFGFKNTIAGNKGLDLYLNWIREETNFSNEVENIKKYQKFADDINGKVDKTKKMILPKIYEELCSDDIIVMEFIENPTLDKLELNDENKKKVADAINSYIMLSFHAMFNGIPIIFHGDPHPGNVYLDEEGNVGFLDMGLVFSLSSADVSYLKELFLTAFSGNVDKLYNILIPYSKMDKKEETKFKNDLKRYIDNSADKNVPYYFVEVVSICLKYQILPPEFLFSMTKTFLCLDGIEKIVGDDYSARELLTEQTAEYMLKDTLDKSKNILVQSLQISPRLLENTLNYGLVKGISKEIIYDANIIKEFRNLLDSFEQMATIVSQDVKTNHYN